MKKIIVVTPDGQDIYDQVTDFYVLELEAGRHLFVQVPGFEDAFEYVPYEWLSVTEV